METIMEVGQRLLQQRRGELGSKRTRATMPQPRKRRPSSKKSSEETRYQCPKCPICRDIGWVRNDARPGEPGFGQVVPCNCNQEVWDIRREKLQRITGMTDAELALRLGDLHARGQDTREMKSAVENIVNDPYGLLTLWGGAGNGKTIALQIIINELRERYQMEGAYILFSDLIDWVRAGFDDESSESERQRYEFIRSVKVLAIDEVEKARLTDYSDEFRFKFLDHRYRLAASGETVTVLAMNCDPESLPYHIYSRLNDGRFRIVHNDDADVRPHLSR